MKDLAGLRLVLRSADHDFFRNGPRFVFNGDYRCIFDGVGWSCRALSSAT